MDCSRREFIAAGARAGAVLLLPAGIRVGLGQQDGFAQLERLTVELMNGAQVPGLSIAVILDGRVVWDRALGVRDAETQAVVDRRTLFEAASVSKTVFAYAALQLNDRGLLSLDTPLTKYTPERILDGDPRLDLITARHILSHTSGLPNFRSRGAPLRIHFTPGERYQYSGEGFWYLQSVMTRITGGRVDSTSCADFEAGLRQCATDMGDYLKRNVLSPLGMRASTYLWNEDVGRNAARPHDEAGRGLAVRKTTPTDAARYAAMGGLRTTALEFASFLIEVMRPSAGPSSRLSPATRNEMIRPQVKVDDSRWWSLGWQVRQTPRGSLIEHQGGQAGVQAFTSAAVERRAGYVILTNSANGWRIFQDERFRELTDRMLLGT